MRVTRDNTHKKNLINNIFNKTGLPSLYIAKIVDDIISILILKIFQKKIIKLSTISEVAEMLNLKDPKTKKLLTHRLRFWETKFKQLKPMILSGRRRYYSEKNISIIKMIIFLLKDQGLTINGAVKVMSIKTKELDATKTLSIKGDYYKTNIKLKSQKILDKIKKLNGKKNTY